MTPDQAYSLAEFATMYGLIIGAVLGALTVWVIGLIAKQY